MQFAHPQALWLFWLLPLVVLAFWWSRKRAAERLGRLASPLQLQLLQDGQSVSRRRWRGALRVLALSQFILALARPQWGASEVDVEQQGIDLVVALDISRSMLAADIQPDRLRRAKVELGDLIESLDGDRVGLVFFAGGAFAQCPLTVDYAAARLFLDQADPSMIDAQGTDLASALSTSLELLGENSGSFQVILLVSDGEDFGGGIESLLDELRRRNVLLYAIGMGTAEGAPIPEFDEGGLRQGFYRDREGQVVMSRLVEAPLLELTRTTGGVYVRAGAGGIDASRLGAELRALEGRRFAARKVTSYEERFAWPLSAGLLLLGLESLVGDRRRRRR
jgi:Ca-activated chloride channel family protein